VTTLDAVAYFDVVQKKAYTKIHILHFNRTKPEI